MDIDTITFESHDIKGYQVQWHGGVTFRVLINAYNVWADYSISSLDTDDGGPPSFEEAYEHAQTLLDRVARDELADER